MNTLMREGLYKRRRLLRFQALLSPPCCYKVCLEITRPKTAWNHRFRSSIQLATAETPYASYQYEQNLSSQQRVLTPSLFLLSPLRANVVV